MSTLAKPLHAVLGTGPLARATAEALLARGMAVRLINTSGRMTEEPAGATVIAANLLDPAAAHSALTGASVVHFCAQPPYHQWVEKFAPLQDAVIAATRRAGARLIVAENLYGYGPSKAPFREDMPLAPNTAKGRVRAQMHRTLMAEHDKGNLPVAVARAADFFGPHVEGSAVGARAMKAVTAGKPAEVMGNTDMPHAYTFIADFGMAMAVLGTNDSALGQVWHVPNAPAVSTRQFFELAFQAAGRPSAGVRRMGRLELQVIGLFVPPVRESIEMLYEFEEPFLVDHSKYVAAFGNHATPLQAALARTLTGPQTSPRPEQK
ncbi:NAD-dependent epimerase/dehydratase family protein [uncultured Devosia sp.]|uniref:NAD-dependent epimerase/dehydratase family protein n=1 Tax=uncultured Devosia sp. TaxID=211434 RepID=UPI0035CC7012